MINMFHKGQITGQHHRLNENTEKKSMSYFEPDGAMAVAVRRISFIYFGLPVGDVSGMSVLLDYSKLCQNCVWAVASTESRPPYFWSSLTVFL